MAQNNVDRIVALLEQDSDGELDDRIEVTLSCSGAIVRSTEQEREEGTGIFASLGELEQALRRFNN